MNLELSRKVHDIGEWLGEGSLNFFGKPFAGKDNQAKKLGRIIGASIFSGGDILRGSVIPPEIRVIMDQGDLIPSDSYAQIVFPFLSQEALRGRPLMLSAVGRAYGEEPGVLAATEAAGHPIKAVPFFEVTDDEVRRRLLTTPPRGRDDDNPASLAIRLEEYEAKTVPVLEVYESMGLLVPIDAMGEKDVVFASMVNLLHDRAMVMA